MESNEILSFFEACPDLTSEIEHRNDNTDLFVLKDKCQEALRTMMFIEEQNASRDNHLHELVNDFNIFYQEISRDFLYRNRNHMEKLLKNKQEMIHSEENFLQNYPVISWR